MADSAFFLLLRVYLIIGNIFLIIDVPGAWQTIPWDINNSREIVGWYSDQYIKGLPYGRRLNLPEN
jgi:hypothetical protein